MRIGKRILKQLAAWKWRILIVYLLLLTASYVMRWRRVNETVAPGVSIIAVPAVRDDKPGEQVIRLAYQEYKPENNSDASVVVLLHGSPGNSYDFRKLAPALAP